MKKTHLAVMTLGSIAALAAFNVQSNAADTPPVFEGEPANGTSGGSPNLPAGGNISSGVQSAGKSASAVKTSSRTAVVTEGEPANGTSGGSANVPAGANINSDDQSAGKSGSSSGD